MIYILSGTQRTHSRSFQVAQIIKKIYEEKKVSCEIMDLAQIPINITQYTDYDLKKQNKKVQQAVDLLEKAQGIHFVIPEYNGSFPGILKHFIDHWKFPSVFEYRPVAFVGLGGRFGGLRPVEHLQGILGYRNAFVYPRKVFLIQIFEELKDNSTLKKSYQEELEKQVEGFSRFTQALQKAKLDANSFLQNN